MTTETPPPLPPKNGKDPVVELKSASQLYWLYSFFLGLPRGLVLALSQTKPDKTGIVIFSCLGLYLLLLVIAGLLLFMKKRVGLYLGWCLLPLILLSFPIGTAVGLFIITKLTRQDVKAILK